MTTRTPTATITADEYNAMHAKRGNKYSAKATEVDGITFASQAEASRYGELKLMERAGEIISLQVHPRFDLFAYGPKGTPIQIAKYTPDFAYVDVATDTRVVEDVKGGKATKTEAYSLRKRLFEACHGIRLTEIGATSRRRKHDRPSSEKGGGVGESADV